MSHVRRTLSALALVLSAVAASVASAGAQAPVAQQGGLQGGQVAAQPAPTFRIAVVNRTAAAEAARGAARRDTTVQPGDVLHYTLTFANATARTLKNVQLSNPLPKGLVLVAGTARASRADARLEFSADGGQTFAAEPTIPVVVNGQTVRRKALPEQFTHVRWTVAGAVSGNDTVAAEYDARVGSGAR